MNLEETPHPLNFWENFVLHHSDEKLRGVSEIENLQNGFVADHSEKYTFSNTMTNAIKKLFKDEILVEDFEDKRKILPKTMVIHVVGAWYRECSASVLEGIVSSLTSDFKLIKFDIRMFGPQLPCDLSNTTINPHEDVKISFFRQLYDVLSDTKNETSAQAHLMFFFNPGIWGYPSWNKTLFDFLNLYKSKIDPVFLVFTGYGEMELDEDEDFLRDLGFHCVWENEKNNASNMKPLSTDANSIQNQMFENNYWCCVSSHLHHKILGQK